MKEFLFDNAIDCIMPLYSLGEACYDVLTGSKLLKSIEAGRFENGTSEPDLSIPHALAIGSIVLSVIAVLNALSFFFMRFQEKKDADFEEAEPDERFPSFLLGGALATANIGDGLLQLGAITFESPSNCDDLATTTVVLASLLIAGLWIGVCTTLGRIHFLKDAQKVSDLVGKTAGRQACFRLLLRDCCGSIPSRPFSGPFECVLRGSRYFPGLYPISLDISCGKRRS